MLKLSDENLHTLQTAAAPINPRLRGRLLEAAEACKNNPSPGEGEFHRIVRNCVRAVMNGDDPRRLS
jgi:hypothetical protein